MIKRKDEGFRYHRALNIENMEPVIGYLWNGSDHAYIILANCGVGYNSEKQVLTASAVEVYQETVAVDTLYSDDYAVKLFDGDSINIGDDVYIMNLSDIKVLNALKDAEKTGKYVARINPNYESFRIHQTAEQNKAASRKMKLVVLERSDSTYDGYVTEIGNDAEIDPNAKVFHIQADTLFDKIKEYTDNGFAVSLLDKSHEDEFPDLPDEVVIWRYEAELPTMFDGWHNKNRKAVKTIVNLAVCDIASVVRLEKNIAGIEIKSGPAKGIYDSQSGAYLGSHKYEVNENLIRCKDADLWDKIAQSLALCISEAEVVSNDMFGIYSDSYDTEHGYYIRTEG